MISFNLAPTPLWCFFDNDGQPLVDGYMRTYRDTNRSETKAVYADAAGTVAYLQPISFNASGCAGPFYWASDENYYLRIFNKDGTLVRDIPAFNAPQEGGVAPITTTTNIRNYVNDPDFRYPLASLIEPVGSGIINTSQTYFIKNNFTATDKIEILGFPLGSTLPPNNPAQYFHYECSVAGSGETTKDLEFRFQSVFSFQNTEIAVGFWCKTGALADQIEIRAKQHFGTGGTPSPDVDTPIATVTAPNNWEQRSGSGVVPSITGKTLGTNADDYLAITLRLPRDAIVDMDITLVQINQGSTLLQYDYLPAQTSPMRQIPFFDPLLPQFLGTSLTVQSNGIMAWAAIVPIGAVLPYAANPVTAPSGFLYCEGQSLLRADYPALFTVLGTTYGAADGNHFNLPDYRGVFLRGNDNGRGIDPGRAFGSTQLDAVQDHLHQVGVQQTGAAGVDYEIISLAGSPLKIDTTPIKAGTAKTEDTETRPINASINFIIRVL